MNALLKQFALVLFVLPLVFAGVAHASHFWRVEVSDPTATDQLRNFNIEFTALSTDSNETITVTLFENSQQLRSVTTPGGGGSGVFNVTVAEDGVYTYEVRANSGGETRDDVATRTVRVSTPEDQITIITVDPDLTPEEEAALIDAGTPGAPATDTEAEGEITDEAAVTDDDEAVLGEQDEDENGEVLGAEDSGDGETGAVVRNILVGLALIALLYYVFFRRRSSSEV